MSQFWMVWNPQGHAPTYKHPYKVEAELEAERLARNNRGQSFFVLEAVGLRVCDDMKRVDLKTGQFDDIDIPF